MRYNPHVVSRVERLAFQLVGDRAEKKMRVPAFVRERQKETLTSAERDTYWQTAIRRELAVSHGN